MISITKENIICKNENDLEKIVLPPLAVGEIIVSGKHVLREYFNNEAALHRNKIFIGEECWHRTGDSGYLDESGTLFLTGRCDTLFWHNNQLITPFLYEYLLQTIPNVTIGTVVKKREKVLVLIEKNNNISNKIIENEVRKMGLLFDEVRFLTLPRDPRHHSKIDYSKTDLLLS